MPHGTADNVREENRVKTCEQCKYSEPTNVTGRAMIALRLCKRYPPSIIIGETGHALEYSAWPMLPFNTCCGEFSRIPE